MTKTVLVSEPKRMQEMVEKRNLKTSFEVTGNWWLPENPDNQIPGTFRFSPKLTSLNLHGAFEQVREILRAPTRTIINGTGDDGTPITLYNCLVKESTITNNNPRVKYFVTYSFHGHHFRNENEIEFNEMSIQFSRLNNWIQTHGFQATNRPPNTMIIEYTAPENIRARINEDLSLSIGFGVTRSFSRSDEKEEKITQHVAMNLENRSNLEFFAFLRFVHHLRNFLTLAILGPEHPLSITGYSIGIIQRAGESQFPRPIQIFYSQGDLPDTSNINEGNMLFTFEEIRENFETYIRNWFDRIDTMGIVGNLYFGTLYNPQSYGNDVFLSIVTSLESFHRIFRDGTIWDDEYFEDLRNRIIQAVPETDREEVRMRFRYANELTLRRRLRELLEEFGFVLTNELGFNADFIGIIVDTRNYYSHYDLQLRDHIIENRNLPRFINRLRVIMEACFLSEFGAEQEWVADVIRKSLIGKNIR